MVNLFSIGMIALLLYEASLNFKQINLRAHIVTQSSTPGLVHLHGSLMKRKRLIAKITLTGVFYFLCELMFHCVWDIYLSELYQGLKYQLRVVVIHEIIDMTVLFLLLNIMKQSAMNPQTQGEAIIDLSNNDIHSNLERTSKTMMFEAVIPCEDSESEMTEFNTFEPIIVIGPTNQEVI